MEKLTKSGIVRSSWTGVVFKALPATFESVRKDTVSKCGLHVLVDLFGCFALQETKVGDDRTMPDFLIFPLLFSILKV